MSIESFEKLEPQVGANLNFLDITAALLHNRFPRKQMDNSLPSLSADEKQLATGEAYPYPYQTGIPPKDGSERKPYRYQDGNIYP